MLRFSMKNHRVVIDPVSLSLECLRLIWMADKTALKSTATDLLTYIHLASQVDQDAPFAKVDPADVSALVRRELFGKYEHKFTGKFDEAFMEEACMSYQMAFDTPEQAAVRVYDKKIYELNKVIDKTKIEVKEVNVRGGKDFISNFPILNKMMQDMTKINAAREALRSAILKQQSTSTIRGQRTVSFIEKRRAEMIKAGVIKQEEDVPAQEENMNPPTPNPEEI